MRSILALEACVRCVESHDVLLPTLVVSRRSDIISYPLLAQFRAQFGRFGALLFGVVSGIVAVVSFV